jgi:hypothetical protein
MLSQPDKRKSPEEKIMQKGFVGKYSVGDFYAMAQETDRTNTTDLSGRTAFGWTGVPIVIAGPNGEIDYEAEYVPARKGFEDHIQLVPKLRAIDLE